MVAAGNLRGPGTGGVRRGHGAPGPAPAAPAADEPRRPGTRAPAQVPVRCPGGVGECLRPEGRLDPGPDRVEIDPDSGQRVPVQAAEQADPRAQPDPAHDLLFDQFRRYAVRAHDRAARLAVGNGGEQDVLAADVAVPEPAGGLLAGGDEGPSGLGKAPEPHRLPIRPPYLRCTVCLVTPG